MSAPFSPAPLGTPDAWREMIAEAAEGAAIQVEMVRSYVYLRDDTGAAYALRCLTAYVQTALSAYGDLREMKETLARQRGEAA